MILKTGDFKINVEQTTVTGKSLIEDLKYQSVDKKGNKYEIEAKKGNIDKNNPDIIYLENVQAIVLLQNSELISIKSNYAKYNYTNQNSKFYDNVKIKYGDGYNGWKEHAPYDKIIITAAPPEIPQELINQLNEGGKMVLPVGEDDQELIVLEKKEGDIYKSNIIPVRFVPMIHEKIIQK